MPPPATREARNILRQRMFFVRVHAMVKSRSFLDRYPELLNSRPRQELFFKQGLAWLKTLPLKG